jgi:signal transduction histidine kinase
MPKAGQSDELPFGEAPHSGPGRELMLTVTFDVAAGCIRFVWTTPSGQEAAQGLLSASQFSLVLNVLNWSLRIGDFVRNDTCNSWPASTRALLKRIRKDISVPLAPPRIGVLLDRNMGNAAAGEWREVTFAPNFDPWRWLEQQIRYFARHLEDRPDRTAPPSAYASGALHRLACSMLGVAPPPPMRVDTAGNPISDLSVSLNPAEAWVEFVWTQPSSGTATATGRIFSAGRGNLTWELKIDGRTESFASSHHRVSIRKVLEDWLLRIPTDRGTLTAFWLKKRPGTHDFFREQQAPFPPDESPYPFLEENIVAMAEMLRGQPPLLDFALNESDIDRGAEFERFERRLWRKEQKRAEEEAKLRERMARVAEERRRRESEKDRLKALPSKGAASVPAPAAPAPKSRREIPLAPVQFVMAKLAFPGTNFHWKILPATNCGNAERYGGFPTSRTICFASRIAASSGLITRCAPRCACSGRSAAARCFRMKSVSAKRSKADSSSRNC